MGVKRKINAQGKGGDSAHMFTVIFELLNISLLRIGTAGFMLDFDSLLHALDGGKLTL